MMVFTPWAFGTTQTWSIWTMNITGFVLGAILGVKWLIRSQSEYQPARWNDPTDAGEGEVISPERKRFDGLTVSLAALTVFLLVYTLVAVINARAIYVEWDRRFEYRNCIGWLPHSYDRWSTLNAFWMYLGWACFFWATWDWVLTKSTRERHRMREDESSSPRSVEPLFSGQELVTRAALGPGARSRTEERHRRGLPDRCKLLLWVLCINGSLLALESILQRLSGTNNLLWLVQPRFNKYGVLQFGPYSYRANAASYFNLVWPVCFGFWLMLRRSAAPSLKSGSRLGSGSHLVLLPGAVLMAACPIISTSRGGALVGLACILVTLAILFLVTRKESAWFRFGTYSLFALILGFGAYLGINQLLPRFQTIFTDQMSRRTEIYANALPIAQEFPILGTGPATFGSLYQLYRSPDQDWAAYVHDDWLETRIGFGWLGLSAIVVILLLVAWRWFRGGGAPVHWEFPAMLWVALGSALLHAKFDFPFQIYSIVLLFLLLTAILFSIERPRQRG